MRDRGMVLYPMYQANDCANFGDKIEAVLWKYFFFLVINVFTFRLNVNLIYLSHSTENVYKV